MRATIPQQLPLVPDHLDHRISRELAEADELIRAHPEWAGLVHADLVRAGQDPDVGRPGMSGDQVLRTVFLKHFLGSSYELLSFQLDDSTTLRRFVGLGWADRAPKKSALQHNLALVRPETWGQVLRGLLTSAEAAEHEDGKKVRVDCTVTETNVHFPSDSSLLWDSIRVLTRLQKDGAQHFGLQFTDHRKAAKRWQKKIYWAKKKQQRFPAYRELLEVSALVAADVRAFLEQLRAWDGDPDWRLVRDALAEKIEHYAGLFARVIDQTRRRVLGGETVSAAEKVLSIHEPHTDLIVKGRKAEFGHKLTFTVGSSGLVLDCVVERGNPKDDTLAVRQIERVKELFGEAPRDAVFDGGFASRENLDAIKGLGAKRCVFSKPRGLSAVEMAGSRRTYGRLKNFRAGVEAAISLLKRAFGLRRCLWRGWNGFKAYVWSAVFAANLRALVRLRL